MKYLKTAKYIKDYIIQVKFSDGEEFVIDLKDHLTGGIFEALKDKKVFSNFELHPDLETIVWKNGADLAPEFLYQLGQSQVKMLA